MPIQYEGKKSIYVAFPALILDNAHEKAWAEKHVVENDHFKYILGRYVETDRPNRNRQHFTMAAVEFGKQFLQYAPLNINHDPVMVGAFVGSEIVYPTGENAQWTCPVCGTKDIEESSVCPECNKPREKSDSDPDLNPYLEALAVFWHHYFEDAYPDIEKAYKSGQLAFSMEAVPSTVGCTGTGGCGQYYEYQGRSHASYCDHINDPRSGIIKDFTDPHYSGGALIVPPVRPGWAHADVTQISKLHAARQDSVEHLYAQIECELPEAEAAWWEEIMNLILVEAELEQVG